MSPPSAGRTSLLERDAERRLLMRAVERARSGSGGAILIEAQAGVGKTELLRVAGSLAEAGGLRVLRSRASGSTGRSASASRASCWSAACASRRSS